jgi:hypothetical protein
MDRYQKKITLINIGKMNLKVWLFAFHYITTVEKNLPYNIMSYHPTLIPSFLPYFLPINFFLERKKRVMKKELQNNRED